MTKMWKCIYGKTWTFFKKCLLFVVSFSVMNFILISALIAYSPNVFESVFHVKIVILPRTSYAEVNNNLNGFSSPEGQDHAGLMGHPLLERGKLAAVRSLKLVGDQATLPIHSTSPGKAHSSDDNCTKLQQRDKRFMSGTKNNTDHTKTTPTMCKYLCPCGCNLSTEVSTQSKNVSIQTILKTFQPIMTLEEKDQLRKLLEVFLLAVKKINLTYFMYGGTLLGSYRHHGIIPWDDDVDLICNASQKLQLKRVLLRHDFEYTVSFGKDRWKFYSRYGAKIRGVMWRYPFVDISFFKENMSYIWDQDPGYAKNYKYLKSNIFPLVKRPFWGHQLFSPKNTYAVLRKNYNLGLCISAQYSHKTEKFTSAENIFSVACVRLWNYYPFVSRTNVTVIRGGSYVNETLKIGSKTIRYEVVQFYT